MTPSTLEKLELLIRKGKGIEVVEILQSLSINEFQREECVVLANMARRVGLPSLALKWLNPIIRPRGKYIDPATGDELGEYSIALVKVGAHKEASEILSQLTPKEFENVHLYQGFAWMSQWEYEKASEEFIEFLNSKKATYSSEVAKVNLASCYIFLGKLREAEIVIDGLLRSLDENKNTLLIGNLYELKIQIALGREDYENASYFLIKSKEMLSKVGGTDSLFIKKWEVVCRLKLDGWTSELEFQFAQVLAEAKNSKHWETMRDLFYHKAISISDVGTLKMLYYGTPWPSFRKKIEKFAKVELDLGQTYEWPVSGKKGAPVLSVRPPAGKTLDRVFNVLCEDFFSPIRAATLFCKVFPDEYYSPDHSEDRVYQAVKRLKGWFVENSIPLSVQTHPEGYSLEALGPISVMVVREEMRDSENQFLRELYDCFQLEGFTVKDVVEKTGTSKSSFNRKIQTFLDSKKIIREGIGKSTKYKIAS